MALEFTGESVVEEGKLVELKDTGDEEFIEIAESLAVIMASAEGDGAD
jgi:hypothetical protein